MDLNFKFELFCLVEVVRSDLKVFVNRFVSEDFIVLEKINYLRDENM